jgi:hypothetical protein
MSSTGTEAIARAGPRVSLANCSVEDGAQIPPKVIDNRECIALGCLAVEEILQLLFPDIAQRSIIEHVHQMRIDSVFVVWSC